MSASSALNNLKEDVKLLEKLFLRKPSPSTSSSISSAPNVSCFRVISASLDELVCEFVDTSMKKYRINANICETYPQSPPVWFSESEDPALLDIIENLSTTSHNDNKILNQVRLLIEQFCKTKNVPLPDNLNELNQNSSSNSATTSQVTEMKIELLYIL